MNLNEQTNRIKQMMGVLSETVQVDNIKDINWWVLISTGRDFLSKQLHKMINVPDEFQGNLTSVVMSITHDLQNSVEKDVMTGNLSNNTINLVTNNIINSITKNSNSLDTIFKKMSWSERKLAKTVGRYKISNAIDKGLILTGDKFFNEGMVSSLKNTYNINSPIVKNYIKVANQLGDSIKNNQKLKTHIMNVILSKL
jgi:hypothetical protein